MKMSSTLPLGVGSSSGKVNVEFSGAADLGGEEGGEIIHEQLGTRDRR